MSKIKVKYDYCGKEIEAYLSQCKDSIKHFCCKNCQNKSQINKYEIKCDNCGNNFLITPSNYKKCKHHFCSRKCANNGEIRKEVCYCSYCGETIKRTPHAIGLVKNHFCNKICQSKWQSDNYIPHSLTNWQGGRCKKSSGYIEVYTPNHPNATARGYVLEHRLIMEKKLGGKLTKDELVHHLNGVRDDNNEENLGITNKNKHEIKTLQKLQAKRIQELEYELKHIYGYPN